MLATRSSLPPMHKYKETELKAMKTVKEECGVLGAQLSRGWPGEGVQLLFSYLAGSEAKGSR